MVVSSSSRSQSVGVGGVVVEVVEVVVVGGVTVEGSGERGGKVVVGRRRRVENRTFQ